jgi:hypothetical protein
MKTLATLSIAALLLAGCNLLEGDPESSPRLTLTEEGRVADLDSVSPHGLVGAPSHIVYRVVLDTSKLDTAQGDCPAVTFLGHSRGSTNYSDPQNWRAEDDWEDQTRLDTRLIYVPTDSAFTHYRVEIDCTGE